MDQIRKAFTVSDQCYSDCSRLILRAKANRSELPHLIGRNFLHYRLHRQPFPRGNTRVSCLPRVMKHQWLISERRKEIRKRNVIRDPLPFAAIYDPLVDSWSMSLKFHRSVATQPKLSSDRCISFYGCMCDTVFVIRERYFASGFLYGSRLL